MRSLTPYSSPKLFLGKTKRIKNEEQAAKKRDKALHLKQKYAWTDTAPIAAFLRDKTTMPTPLIQLICAYTNADDDLRHLMGDRYRGPKELQQQLQLKKNPFHCVAPHPTHILDIIRKPSPVSPEKTILQDHFLVWSPGKIGNTSANIKTIDRLSHRKGLGMQAPRLSNHTLKFYGDEPIVMAPRGKWRGSSIGSWRLIYEDTLPKTLNLNESQQREVMTTEYPEYSLVTAREIALHRALIGPRLFGEKSVKGNVVEHQRYSNSEIRPVYLHSYRREINIFCVSTENASPDLGFSGAIDFQNLK
jgi:hypothetical protein